MNFNLFAVTAPGIEPFARQELAAFGITASLPQQTGPSGEARDESGGVEFVGGLTAVYRSNLHLRTANRVLVRLGDFAAENFIDLRKRAAALPWEHYLLPGQPVAMRVSCHKSRLYHSDAVAERVAAAVGDHLGQSSDLVKFDETADAPTQLVIVRILRDRCTISIDSSGPLLHRRGYRLETAKAPLRETLAAGLLLASGWDAAAPLIDPFCGSGTLAIEAALLARRIAPGKSRRFAFMNWPIFEPTLWEKSMAEAAARELPACAPLLASDRDEGAIRISQANAQRAGVFENIQFSCKAFSDLEPPAGPGWLVTNPPYGIRVSPSHDLRNLYTRLGDVLRALCPGWQVGILCSDEILVGHTRLPLNNSLPLVNGGIPVTFFMGRVPKS